MPHVHFVLPDLGYSAAAKQVSLVAPALVRPGWSSAVYSLGGGPFAAPLQASGVPVTHSTVGLVRNWGLLRFIVPKPGHGIVHAFGLRVLRRLWVATIGTRRPPVVLSLTGRERFTRLDRHCLGIVSRVLVHHQHAAAALIAQGIPVGRVSIVPPAAGRSGFQPDPSNGQVGNLTYQLGIPADAPLIVTAGRMDDRYRLLNAVWAFEFVRYPHVDAHLIVIGDGPGRAGMELVARGLAPEGSRVHFLDARPDVPAILAMADVVMVPHLWGGANVALEAMAAGRAVVAAHTPDLAAVVRDGETGWLVPPRDATAAASAVRKLLLDPEGRRQLGDTARDHVREGHSVGTVVRAMETIYSGEFTSTRSGLWAE